MEIIIATAEIMPDAKHILLLRNEKPRPQSMTDRVKPVIMITIANTPNKVIKPDINADNSPNIAMIKAAIDVTRQIMGKTSFIILVYHQSGLLSRHFIGYVLTSAVYAVLDYFQAARFALVDELGAAVTARFVYDDFDFFRAAVIALRRLDLFEVVFAVGQAVYKSLAVFVRFDAHYLLSVAVHKHEFRAAEPYFFLHLEFPPFLSYFRSECNIILTGRYTIKSYRILYNINGQNRV